MPFQGAPFPSDDAIVSEKRKATQVFIDWLTALGQDVDASPARVGTKTLTAQAASIGATALPTGSLSGGYFRVTTYARITQAATTSSSLTVSIGFMDGAVNCTLSGVALTGNTTATTQSFSVMVKNDAGASLTYATTYASVGGTPMQYALTVVVEQVQA